MKRQQTNHHVATSICKISYMHSFMLSSGAKSSTLQGNGYHILYLSSYCKLSAFKILEISLLFRPTSLGSVCRREREQYHHQ